MNPRAKSDTHHYFIGWDVGAWNCDDNRKSRDALCVIHVGQKGKLEVIGEPWRNNLRDVLHKNHGVSLIRGMLELCNVPHSDKFDCTIGIDTPLGWPKAMIKLVTKGKISRVPRDADSNPYLFRETELQLFQDRLRPLSAIRDMIGSQSTKGIHFLSAVAFKRRRLGVWDAEFGNTRCTALETYPAPCVKSSIVNRHFRRLSRSTTFKKRCGRGRHVRADVEDSLRCAIVAYLFHSSPSSLRQPTAGIDDKEGWIWLPADCIP